MTRLILIAGMPRSGSTALGRVLAQRSDVAYSGEIMNIDRALARDSDCRCGQRVQSCPIWGPAIASIGLVPGDKLDGAQGAWLLEYIGGRYKASVVVDSSKKPSKLAAIARSTHFEVTIVHLVRDPRGHILSAHLGFREKQADGTSPPLRIVLRISWAWLKRFVVVRFRLRGLPVSLIRYEDFAARPSEVLASLIGDSSISGSEGGGSGDEHMIAANVGTRSAREIDIKLDERWVTQIPRGFQILSWLLTFPISAILKYPPFGHLSCQMVCAKDQRR